MMRRKDAAVVLSKNERDTPQMLSCDMALHEHSAFVVLSRELRCNLAREVHRLETYLLKIHGAIGWSLLSTN